MPINRLYGVMAKPPFPSNPFRKSFSKDKPFFKPKPKQPLNEAERKLVFNPENDLIYGVHPVIEALKNPKRKLVKLWASENAAARLKEDVNDLKVEPEIVHPRLLDHMLKSPDAVHQGIILEAKPLDQPHLDKITREGVVVLLDQVTDPHNVGAIMRSCAAFNVTALVVTARHAAETAGVFFKAASGAVEHVPYVTVTNLARAMAELKTYGFVVVGLDSEAPDDLERVAKHRPLALVLGAEGKGMRQLTRDSCDHLGRIAMPGEIKSLNVSIAAAVSLYALTR